MHCGTFQTLYSPLCIDLSQTHIHRQTGGTVKQPFTLKIEQVKAHTLMLGRTENVMQFFGSHNSIYIYIYIYIYSIYIYNVCVSVFLWLSGRV